MVSALVVHDDGSGPALYAGGDFLQAGGVPASCIAKWDGTSWSPLGGGLTNSVRCLASFDDGTGSKLFAGGYVYTADGSPVSFIAQWDGSSWTGVGGGLSSIAYSMVVHDDGTGPALYVGGAFSFAGGNPANQIAKWDGTAWSALGAGLPNDVMALASFDDGTGPALYAGIEGSDIQRWNGSTWSPVGMGPVTVYSLAEFGGDLIAGGSFSYVNGGANHANHIARWDGTQWHALGNPVSGGGTDGSVMTLQVFDDGTGSALFAGGGFEFANTVPAHWMAKWNGSAFSSLGTGIDSGISNRRPYSMAAFDDGSGEKLFVAGEFDLAGGKQSKNIAAWHVPCTAPIILQQPVSQTTVFNEPVVFSVVGEGTAPVTYRWRKNGVNLVNEVGRIEGATTPTLTLYYWDYGDAGNYTCKVQNVHGNVTSDAAVLTVPLGGELDSPFQLDKILFPPESVPGHPGFTYTRFTNPVQSSAGDVTFLADISGSPTGSDSINVWRSGTSELLYQDYDPAPGTPSGVVFGGVSANAFTSLVVGASGGVAFTSELSGPGVNNTNRKGVWYRDSSGGDLVMRLGDPAPGFPSGATFHAVGSRILTDDSGQVLFYADVFQSGSFVGYGLWSWHRSSGVVPLAVTGQSAPGTTESFTTFEQPPFALGQGGTAAFFAVTTGASSGIWAGTPGSLQLVAKVGDAVPGWPSGTTFQSVYDPLVDDVGRVAFSGRVQNGGGPLQRGLFRWDTGTITTLVAQGDVVPSLPTHTFDYPKPIAMNAGGAMLFFSSIFYPGCPDACPTHGYFYLDSVGIETIVTNRANPLPEVPPGYNLELFSTATLNDSGQVLVGVTLYFGEHFGALYGWLRGHGLFPIAVPGTQFEVSPGVYRTVAGAGIAREVGGIGGQEGPSTGLTDDGQAIIMIGFTNLTAGIFSGHFTGFGASYFPPGTSFCAGDGSLPTPCPCANTGQPGRGCENSIATGGAHMTSFGGASLTEDTVVLTTVGERPTSVSILLQGTTNITAGVTYGDGVRCVGGILKRIVTRNAVAGTLAYPLAGDLSISARSTALGNPISPGATRYYQTYYRDGTASFCPIPPGNTFNVGNGQIIQWFP